MITNLAFNTDGSVVVTKDDGSVTTLTATPVAASTDTEVDVIVTAPDGSTTTKKFVPAQ